MYSVQLTPLQRYQNDLQKPDFKHDPSQQQAVECLQSLYDRLLAGQRKSRKKRLRPSLKRRRRPQTPEKGLYFWGGVGRGKTYLMDNFYETLPFENKMRVHFHRFMRRVHQELKTLGGQPNPLEIVADRIAADARVICFDEFYVSDITDAMILGSLLEKLFERGTALVASGTSCRHQIADLTDAQPLHLAEFLARYLRPSE